MNYLKPLLKIMRPVIGYMLAALALTILTALSAVGLLTTGAYLIASAALQPPLYTLTLPILGVRCFGISRAVLRYAERYISHNATFRILSHLRTATYSRLEKASPLKNNTKSTAELCDLLLHQIDTLKDFYLRVLAPLSSAIIIVIIIAAIIACYLPLLAICLLSSFLIIGLIIPAIISKANNCRQQQIEVSRLQLHNSLVDILYGHDELVVNNRLADRIANIKALTNKTNEKKYQLLRQQALADTTTDICIALLIIMAFYLATPLINQQQFSGIELAMLILLLQSTFETAALLPAVWLYYTNAKHAAKQLFFYLTEAAPTGQPAKPPKSNNAATAILSVNQLCFAYPDAAITLNDITFTIKSGEKTALVGANGSGKSTLFALLLKLYQPSSGNITLQGFNYTDSAPADIRKYFAAAAQSSHIFQGTIRDNFKLLQPEATEAEITAALAKAELTKFINSLPQGIDTPLGRNGQTLSGGQRQRLILAIALLKPAPIILLDEPTKGLDPATADKIINTLFNAPKQTLLWITHDLTALKQMDKIIVLEAGKICESGTYQQLLKQRGAFFELLQYCYNK